MKNISTRKHGIFDYSWAVILVISPYVFQFQRTAAAAWIPVAAGLVLAAYSYFTDYSFGYARQIPLKVHKFFDLALGIFLALSPWIFGFAGVVFLPHLLAGIILAAAGLLTKDKPIYHRVNT